MQQIVARHLPGTSAEIVFENGYPAMERKPGSYEVLELFDQVSRDRGHGEIDLVRPLIAVALLP